VAEATPLMLAISNRDAAAARKLLEQEPALGTAALPGGISPLMYALYNGAREIVEMLRGLREPELMEAAALNDARRVAELCAVDLARVSSYSPDGWTPLHLAAFFGAREAAFVLIGLGAPLEAISQNPMSNTPLHASIAGAGGELLAPLLLAFGADPVHVGGSGVGALHLAASRGFDGLCGLLIKRGADRDAQTEDGKTAAQLARERGHMTTAALLERAGN
jgi:ankyrin repeat protein